MKKLSIRLTDRHWASNPQGRIHLRGAAFAAGMLHRRPQEIAMHLPLPGEDIQRWLDCLHDLNGFFALVCEMHGKLVAAVDRVRSIPLFYGEDARSVFLSDDAEWIRQQVADLAMDPVARDEFQLTGYVTGRDTLYPNVKQLQAGELLVIDTTANGVNAGAMWERSAITAQRYYSYLHDEPAAINEAHLMRGLESTATASVNRLIDYADGRQIVIPLSGGYDSRLIATLLCKAGYRNIFTFTYGFRRSREAAYSRQVARSLGLPWHFIEYSEAGWRAAWDGESRSDLMGGMDATSDTGSASGGEGRRYQQWASGWASIPHIQDWLAVSMLRRARRIAEDCVFAPGHIVAGCPIPLEAFRNRPVTADLLVKKILRQHYWRSAGKSGPRPRPAAWKKRILDRADVEHVYLPTELADAFEKWDWQERQAKFICNSVRIYEFFGYDWWMPLWDAEFMAFWQGVPLALRRERLWYLDYVKREYAAVSTCSDSGPDSLNNATDIGRVEAAIRTLIGRIPMGVKESLKAMRYRATPKRGASAYAVSHLPVSEVRRLEKEGYRGDDMLVQEFLRQATERPL